MKYQVEMKRDGKFYLVTFPDIPEAITQGKSLAEARAAARDALVTALDFYFDDGREVPKPGKAKAGQETVSLPVSVAAKVLVLNEMLRQNVRPADLARRMRTTPQEITRLTNLKHTSKIDGLASAMEALGKKLEIRAI
jgi:antitoxin HicB